MPNIRNIHVKGIHTRFNHIPISWSTTHAHQYSQIFHSMSKPFSMHVLNKGYIDYIQKFRCVCVLSNVTAKHNNVSTVYTVTKSVRFSPNHYRDVIMSALASQITAVSIVYLTVCSGAYQRNHQISASLAYVRGIRRWPVNSPYKRPVTPATVYSGADQRKEQSSASLAFVRGIHRWPVNSPHKWPVTRKMFPIDDVIMTTKHNKAGCICICISCTVVTPKHSHYIGRICHSTSLSARNPFPYIRHTHVNGIQTHSKHNGYIAEDLTTLVIIRSIRSLTLFMPLHYWRVGYFLYSQPISSSDDESLVYSPFNTWGW